jgi:hypothetical protein
MLAVSRVRQGELLHWWSARSQKPPGQSLFVPHTAFMQRYALDDSGSSSQRSSYLHSDDLVQYPAITTHLWDGASHCWYAVLHSEPVVQ